MRIVLLLNILLLTISVYAQNGRYLDREIQIEADNDAFTLDLYADQYYSQGSYGRYRVVDTTGFMKTIKSIALNHRIYTPRFVFLKDVEQFDRPYAGQLSVTGSLTFYDKRSVREVGLELGVMGKASLAEPIQVGWHKFFGMTQPEGWDYQINNSPIINGYFKYAHLLVRAGNIQILSESNAAAGTAFVYGRQDVVVRLGKFKDLDESVQYGANLGSKKKKSKYTQETILFGAIGPEYVFYNSTIEGNIIGEPSIHTEEIVPWVLQGRVGAMFAWSSFDLAVMYYFRTVETKGAVDHKYVGIRLSKRF
jgi:hypothetical protein